MRSDDKHSKSSADPIDFMEAAIELAAEQQAEEGSLSEADLRFAGEQQLRMRPLIAELRRRLVPVQPIATFPAPINRELGDLSRETLLARIESLRQRGNVQYICQDLVGLTDEDLRQTLSLLLETTEG